jgi:hypothetical protein
MRGPQGEVVIDASEQIRDPAASEQSEKKRIFFSLFGIKPLDNPIAKGFLRADATGIALHILMKLDFKRSAGHGVKVDARNTDYEICRLRAVLY